MLSMFFLGNQEGRAPTLIALNKSMYMQERCRNAGSVKTGITKEKKRNSETIQWLKDYNAGDGDP
jgi:hypothetical protein